jgi:hypothetical protein
MPQPDALQNKYFHEESPSRILPSNVSQEIDPSGGDTDVTLSNPQAVENGDSTAATIYIKYDEDSAYRARYFQAGEKKICRPKSIGGTGTGTTASTVFVDGIK